MKVFSEKTVISMALKDLRCNMCGRDIDRDAFGYFDDHVSIKKTWGYHSPIDGETHSFDVCFDCYRDWIRQFQIPPRITQPDDMPDCLTECDDSLSRHASHA